MMKKLLFFVSFVSFCVSSFSTQNGVSYNTSTTRVSQTNLIYIASDITVTGSFHATNNYISLSGQTNRLTMSGNQLLLDGVPLGSGGGGDTIWTNDSGNIELIDNPGSMSIDAAFGNVGFAGSLTLSTNLVVLDPLVADGASAVAFKFDTENALSTAGAKLATFGNGGTNRVQVNWNGATGQGITAFDEWNPTTFMQIIENDISRGENENQRIVWEVVDSPDYHYYSTIEFKNLADPVVGTGKSELTLETESTNTDSQVILRAQNGSSLLDILTKLTLWPDQADGGTPYTFDTSLTHTSGNLAEFKNNGPNVFTVAANSGYTGAGTLFLSDDGTYKAGGDTIWTNDAGSVEIIGSVNFTVGASSGAITGASLTESSVGNSGFYFPGFMEIDSIDTDYTLNTISFAGSDGNPSMVMQSTGETTAAIPYVFLRPAQLGASWALGSVPFMFNTRTNIATGNLVFGLGNNETNIFAVTGGGGVVTSVPASATNALPVRFGQIANGVVTLDTARYMQADINGTAVKLLVAP